MATEPSLFAEVPGRALAVYAHPDDPDISCGGTLARWADQGCDVRVLLCTDGDKGTADPGRDVEEVAALRRDESARAMAALGIGEAERLGWPDGELENDRALRSAIVTRVRSLRPDVVLCPDPLAVFFGTGYFNHRDHRAVGWAALDAVAPASMLPHYFPEAGPAHRVARVLMSGTLEPHVYVDIASTLERKLEAVAAHASQLPGGGEWALRSVRESAAEAGRQVGVPFAEAYRLLELEG